MTLESPFSLTGKVAIVTGASAGLGARMAAVLGAAGARVALVARRTDGLEKISADIPGSVVISADLTDSGDVAAIVPRVRDALGPIDVLVNNAAWIAGGVRAQDETPEQLQRMIATNLVAPIRLTQAAFGDMIERGGSIVNVTSIVASVAIARFPQATYSATKGGLLAITREWAAQWGRYGIRVNAIAPGFIETEMTESVIHESKVREWVRTNTFLGRHGRPDDFDGALLLLASDAGRYITGQSITVDGGWTAR